VSTRWSPSKRSSLAASRRGAVALEREIRPAPGQPVRRGRRRSPDRTPRRIRALEQADATGLDWPPYWSEPAPRAHNAFAFTDAYRRRCCWDICGVGGVCASHPFQLLASDRAEHYRQPRTAVAVEGDRAFRVYEHLAAGRCLMAAG
jgi:hypothetical protein